MRHWERQGIIGVCTHRTEGALKAQAQGVQILGFQVLSKAAVPKGKILSNPAKAAS